MVMSELLQRVIMVEVDWFRSSHASPMSSSTADLKTEYVAMRHHCDTLTNATVTAGPNNTTHIRAKYARLGLCIALEESREASRAVSSDD
jgi:hypothetical protein